jgi:glutamine amidotransferase
MCELFGMSARHATNIHVSLAELARHGGQIGPHRDGWGVGYMQEGDALVVREPEAASDSEHLAFLKTHEVRSAIVLAHIRRATQGPRKLRNTQPFARELGGRVHLFAHNGMLPGIERDPRLPARRFRRVGDTDSEQAFCALLERLAPIWDDGIPSLEARTVVIAELAADLRPLGPANFLYSDGDALFAHGHRRRHDTGEIRPPGLHVLCRRCSAASDGVPVSGLSISPDHEQEVALVASVPLTAEPWQALYEGEIAVLREGRVVRRARS